jgi:hypothetical protein
MGIFGVPLRSLRGFLHDRAGLVFENLALRHQLNVLQRSVKRVRLRRRDRVFWALLSRLWDNWRSSLMIVKRFVLCQLARLSCRRLQPTPDSQ